MRVSTLSKTLDEVEVECTHCGVAMTGHATAGSPVRYFHCASCHRWVSSTYSEVLRTDAKMRVRRKADAAPNLFGTVKARLEQWLSDIESNDPYRLLGVSKTDSHERIRERYRELARLNHPDRGGSAAQMQKLNEAYERILEHRSDQGAPVPA
jgi:hypothetical protein